MSASKYEVPLTSDSGKSGDVSLGVGVSTGEWRPVNIGVESKLNSASGDVSVNKKDAKAGVKKRMSSSNAKDAPKLLDVLWSSVLPKMTVLVVSSDLVFTTLISQMVISIGATPVVVSAPRRTRQILRHRLKYATDVAIIVHQSECYATVLSLDDLFGEMEQPEEVTMEDGLETFSPNAAALDYQPWYDIASLVRHRDSRVSSADAAPVVVVSMIAVITGNPDSSGEWLTPTSNRISIINDVHSWDSSFAECLCSEAVFPLVAPFTRTNFVLALGHMQPRVSEAQGKASYQMPEHVVLSVSDGAERSTLAGVLRKAGIDHVAVETRELDVALMLQVFDVILLCISDSEPQSQNFAVNALNWGLPMISMGQGQSQSDHKQQCKDSIAYIQNSLGISTPILVLAKRSADMKDEMIESGAVNVLESPCSELDLYKAIVLIKEDKASQATSPSMGRNRNAKQNHRDSAFDKKITSSDGVSKNLKPNKRRASQIKVAEAAEAAQQSLRARNEVKRRGSWSGGWVSLASSDTRMFGCSRGATHHVPQDRIFLLEDFISKGNTFFGTFDGHGPLGQHISTFIGQTISGLLLKDEQITSEEDFPEAIPRACAAAFQLMREMHNDDALESGCTATFGIVTPSAVYVGNVGDSRTCYVRKSKAGCCGLLGGSFDAKAISVDHSPTLAREADRVKQCGGLVMQMGPVLRVVHPGSGGNLRGLAMTRSFGDLWAYDIGVVPEPDVFVHKLTPDDTYIMCGSDGIWDMLSEVEVAKMLPGDSSNAVELSVAVKVVVETAVTRWKSKNMEADDCSFCVVVV